MKRLVVILSAVLLLVACSNQDKQENDASMKDESNSKTSVALEMANIKITNSNEKIVIEGDAKATNDVFYFTLSYGEKVVVEETKVTLKTDDTSWGSFHLEIEQPKTADTEEQIPLFTFYVKNDAGDIVNPNYIPVDEAK